MLIEDVNEEGPAGAALATPGMKPVLAGAVLLVLRLAQPPDYPLSGRSPDGEITGRLAQVESGVVLIQPDTPGSSLVPLLLTKGTRIKVGTQEGWIGDLRPGGPVTVAYELFEGKRLAQTVAVPDAGQARPAEPAPKPTPAAKAAEVQPAQPAPPAPAPAPARAATPAPVPAAPVQPAAAKPAPAQPPVAAQPPVPKPVAPAPAAAGPQPAPPVREPERAREAEATDGSAAVDWLLNNRR